MKVTNINSHCEFNSLTGCTDYYFYFYFEDGSKVRIDGFTRWSAELAEKLESGSQEEHDMIIGWHRYLERFTSEVAREYAKLDKEHWLPNKEKSMPIPPKGPGGLGIQKS